MVSYRAGEGKMAPTKQVPESLLKKRQRNDKCVAGFIFLHVLLANLCLFPALWALWLLFWYPSDWLCPTVDLLGLEDGCLALL